MTKRNRLDPKVAAAMRIDLPAPLDDSRLAALAARIDGAARPLLDERRLGRRDTWWDIAGDWSRLLIPGGLTVAAAAGIAILWLARPVSSAEPSPVVPPAPPPNVILGTVRAAISQPSLVDSAVAQIVGPTPSQPRQ